MDVSSELVKKIWIYFFYYNVETNNLQLWNIFQNFCLVVFEEK